MALTTTPRITVDTSSTQASPSGAMVRHRVAVAAAMTAVAVAIALGVGVAFGPTFLLLSGFTLPAPLMLLWLSADVLRADEKDSRR
jgi:hypothetical protein